MVNVVSILPYEYGCIAGENAEEVVEKELSELEAEEMALHKPICYFMLNNGSVESQEAFFEKPTMGMKNHLKPLLIRANVEGVAINKVLVYCGATVNIMPAHILKKIGKYENEVRPNNVVLSDYGGKIAHTLGVIQVNITVGSVTRPTIFMHYAKNWNRQRNLECALLQKRSLK